MLPTLRGTGTAPAPLRRGDGGIVLHQHLRAAQRDVHLGFRWILMVFLSWFIWDVYGMFMDYGMLRGISVRCSRMFNGVQPLVNYSYAIFMVNIYMTYYYYCGVY